MKIHGILIIDDDPIVNFIHRTIIASEFDDYPLFCFENGFEAFGHILINPKKSYLIFLDINMPVMDGWEFLETVCQADLSNNLSVHILTSSLDMADIRRAEKYSLFKSFQTKPLSRVVLQEMKFQNNFILEINK